jgi:pyridinium-3,5-biscarboxylic acid mononucleotide sulfurtransferase
MSEKPVLGFELSAGLDGKYDSLRERIRGYGRAAVAFSGGVDSSFLCAVARAVLGDGAAAITVVSPMLPRSELDDARAVSSSVGIRHVLVEEGSIDAGVAANPADRCYHCKKLEFGVVIRAAAELGIGIVMDGSNADDASDYRPGSRAVAELGVVSPLKETGLGKAEIRELSRRLGLKTWDKPAFACLASRIPYGEPIPVEALRRVEDAEGYLRGIGFRQFRVRSHGSIARIEVEPGERAKFFDTDSMDRISKKLKEFGFLYVSLELEGYRTGSLNRELTRGEIRHG